MRFSWGKLSLTMLFLVGPALPVLPLEGDGSARPGEQQRVVVISIDAFRPEFYRGAGWDTPNLHRLAHEGASAERMLSVFPSVTYVNHTSLVTGVRPARHGIMANTVFDSVTGPQPA